MDAFDALDRRQPSSLSTHAARATTSRLLMPDCRQRTVASALVRTSSSVVSGGVVGDAGRCRGRPRFCRAVGGCGRRLDPRARRRRLVVHRVALLVDRLGTRVLRLSRPVTRSPRSRAAQTWECRSRAPDEGRPRARAERPSYPYRRVMATLPGHRPRSPPAPRPRPRTGSASGSSAKTFSPEPSAVRTTGRPSPFAARRPTTLAAPTRAGDALRASGGAFRAPGAALRTPVLVRRWPVPCPAL